MNDQDYISRAVELVRSCNAPWDYYAKNLSEIKKMSVVERDALSAQLKRQVDATDKFYVKETPTYSGVFERTGHDHVPVAGQSGDDRIMNTIKVTVDSGVLVPEGQDGK